MTYRIVEQDGKTVVEIPCEGKLEVQGWALEWVKAKASADEYRIRDEDNDIAKLLRTSGGQWYLMNA